MKYFKKLKDSYFSIPRKYRFLAYYIIALLIFVSSFAGADKNWIEEIKKYNVIAVKTFEKSYEEGTVSYNIVSNILTGISFIISYLLFTLPITITYLLERGIKKDLSRDNSNYTPAENIIYYRELLDGVSPATISILDNLEMEERKDLSAGLLKLILSGHLVIENNILKVTDKSTKGLSSSQMRLYRLISDGSFTKQDYSNWKKECYNEAVNTRLVKKNLSGEEAFTKIMSRWMTIVIIILVIHFTLGDLQYEFAKTMPSFLFILLELMSFVTVACMVIAPIYLILHLVWYYAFRHDYGRTYLGNKEKDRIEGLKRFIKDYSLLDQKSKEEVVLWDDYLIYAVLFENNTKIINDLCQKKNLTFNIEDLENNINNNFNNIIRR